MRRVVAHFIAIHEDEQLVRVQRRDSRSLMVDDIGPSCSRRPYLPLASDPVRSSTPHNCTPPSRYASAWFTYRASPRSRPNSEKAPSLEGRLSKPSIKLDTPQRRIPPAPAGHQHRRVNLGIRHAAAAPASTRAGRRGDACCNPRASRAASRKTASSAAPTSSSKRKASRRSKRKARWASRNAS